MQMRFRNISDSFLKSLITAFSEFGLVILCSRENEERAHIVAALEEYRVTGMARYPKPEEIRRYLEIQFTAPQERPGSYGNQDMIWSPASDVNRPGK